MYEVSRRMTGFPHKLNERLAYKISSLYIERYDSADWW